MTNFTVYKIEKLDGTTEYKAFSQEFLKSPWVENVDFGTAFLEPIDARKYYQVIGAETEQEAIATAQNGHSEDWRWSSHNFLPPEWYARLKLDQTR